MAEFQSDAEITTDTPTIEVTLSLERPLPVGRHTFQLVVEDEAGHESRPDEVTVIVADLEPPRPSCVRHARSVSAAASTWMARGPSTPAAAMSSSGSGPT